MFGVDSWENIFHQGHIVHLLALALAVISGFPSYLENIKNLEFCLLLQAKLT